MNQYDCMLAFVRTFEAGSFSGAARNLRVSQPTISKRIAELEQQFRRAAVRAHHAQAASDG